MNGWKHHESHPVTGTCVWCHANSTSSVGCTRGESAEEKVARLETERRKGGAMKRSYGAPEASAVPERCSRCNSPCGITRYYIQDFRDGFIQYHVYCSQRCAEKDLNGDD